MAWGDTQLQGLRSESAPERGSSLAKDTQMWMTSDRKHESAIVCHPWAVNQMANDLFLFLVHSFSRNVTECVLYLPV